MELCLLEKNFIFKKSIFYYFSVKTKKKKLTFKIKGKMLTKLDYLFKTPIVLRSRNQETASTKFGVLLSLFIMAVLTYAFSQSDIFY